MSITWTQGSPPDEMKDGREVLAWVSEWKQSLLIHWGDVTHRWCDECGGPLTESDISHWSDVNPPVVTP